MKGAADVPSAGLDLFSFLGSLDRRRADFLAREPVVVEETSAQEEVIFRIWP